MSMYMSFFFRVEDKFYPITSYSRNSAVYQTFAEVISPNSIWEKITPVTTDMLNAIRRGISAEIHKYQEGIKSCERQIAIISDMNDPLNEKIDAMQGYIEAIDDYEDEIKELKYARTFTTFLDDMIDEIELSDEYDWNGQEYIYVGVEISKPTIEDIV